MGSWVFSSSSRHLILLLLFMLGSLKNVFREIRKKNERLEKFLKNSAVFCKIPTRAEKNFTDQINTSTLYKYQFSSRKFAGDCRILQERL